jgi:hypothetical protein
VHKGFYYNDKRIIKEYVGWNDLREKFKNYFNIQVLKETQKNHDFKELGQWSVLATSFTNKIEDHVVDTYLNLEGLSLLLENNQNFKKISKPNFISLLGRLSLMDFTEHSSFVVIYENSKKEISVIFDRIGFKWKITEIRFPDNFLKEMQN